MAAIPPEGARVRLFLTGDKPRVIDCTVGVEVTPGKVTILQTGRGDGEWEPIPWAQVYSLHRLDAAGALLADAEPALPLKEPP